MSLKQSFSRYLEIDAEHWSILKEMHRSPLRYAYRRKVPREDATALARGRAVHTAVLEPDLFAKEYVIFEGARRQGKAWDEFAEAYADKTILKVDEYDKAWQCAAAIKKHPEVAAMLRVGKPEQSFTWKDSATGLRCKCRVDWIGDVLFDLKTTGNVDARIFGNLAARMLYHGQLAMYADGSKHAGEVYIVAAEAEPPHDVAVYRLGDDELAIGRELYQGFLQRVVECRTADRWPGKYPEREKLSLPRYVYGDDDQDDGTSVIVEEKSV